MSPLMNEPKSKGGFDLGDYVEVRDRIRLFYERYPDGRLVTERVEVWMEVDPPRVVVKALAYRTPDDPLPGDGWSWMTLPGTTSYTRGSEIENTQTSAWGRAIGSLGIGIDKSIASRNEIDAKSGEPGEPETTHDGSLVGTVAAGKPPVDLQLRQTPDGAMTGFSLTSGRTRLQVVANGTLADVLYPFLAELVGQRVSCWGTIELVPWERDGKTMPPYRRLILERIQTPDFTLPAPDAPQEAPSAPLFAEDDLSDLPAEWNPDAA